jgi:hypothetical protein
MEAEAGATAEEENHVSSSSRRSHPLAFFASEEKTLTCLALPAVAFAHASF